MKIIKKLSCLIIAGLMLFSVTGCGSKKLPPMQAETPDVYYFERFGDEVMPIGGYIGPTLGFGHNGNYYPSQVTDEHYAQVAECGLNFIIGTRPSYAVDSQTVLDALYYADKNDVMYYVYDTGLFIINDANAKDPDNYLFVTEQEFAERVEAYRDYPSFAGIYCRDEPFAKHFDQIEAVFEVFDKVFAGTDKQLYINSNSLQCPEGWFGGGENGTAEEREMTVEEYMTEWFESFPTLDFYSYDTYPFINAGDYIRTDIFKNYSLVRDFSQRYNKPFWTFMQAGGNWGGSSSWRLINEGEMWWQISTALAFGAKGYEFFPYNCPPEQVGSAEGDEGLVGRGGQKNSSWYYAKNANEQTLACDHILMKSVYKGLIQVLSGKDDSTNAIEIPKIETQTLNGKFREVTSITGDNSITGCFNYQGKTALYVVNNSITRDKAKVKINLNGKHDLTVIQRGVERHASGNMLELTFAPGEGACVVID